MYIELKKDKEQPQLDNNYKNTLYHLLQRSFSKFFLVMVIAVEGPHKPIIFEELHAFFLSIDIVQDELSLYEHFLLLKAIAVPPPHKLLRISAVPALQDEPIQGLFIGYSNRFAHHLHQVLTVRERSPRLRVSTDLNYLMPIGTAWSRDISDLLYALLTPLLPRPHKHEYSLTVLLTADGPRACHSVNLAPAEGTHRYPGLRSEYSLVEKGSITSIQLLRGDGDGELEIIGEVGDAWIRYEQLYRTVL